MDQDVINLAKAIRQKESGGNFDAVGDNGTSRGAYQWQANTWKGHAKQILGDENAPMTKDHQQAVAYGMMKTWKDQGLNPAQIAAKWNSGSEKGWENKIGTNVINGKPIQYNVPQYVKDVTDNYQKFKLESTQGQQYTASPEAPQVEKPGFLASIGNAITDPFVALGGGVANIIRPMIGQEVNREKIPSIFGGEGVNPVGSRDGQEIGAVDTAQQLAGNVAMAGSNFVGAGLAKSVGTGIATRTMPKIASLAKEGALASGLYSGGESASQGNTVGEIAKDTAIGAGIGAVAGPVLGGATAGVMAAGKKLAPELVNSLIGSNRAFNKAIRLGHDPGESVVKYGITANNIEELAPKISQSRQDVGQLIGQAYDMPHNVVKVSNYNEILTPLQEAITKASQNPKSERALIGRLKSIVADLSQKDLSNMTPRQAFDMKQQIKRLMKFTGNPTDDVGVNGALNGVYGKLVAKLNKIVPELTELNKDYGGLMSAELSAETKAQRLTGNMGSGDLIKGGAIGGAVALATGGIGLIPLLAGAVGSGLLKILNSTAFKTRAAKFLAGATSADIQATLRGKTIAEQQIIIDAYNKIMKENGIKRILQLPAPKSGAAQSENLVPLKVNPTNEKDISKGFPKDSPTVVQTVNTLEQEAKKYKSAEEFVSNIKKLSNEEKIKITKDLENLHNKRLEDFSKNSVVSDLFHATPHDFSEFKLTQGERAGVLGGNKKIDNLAIFTTDNKELAKHFGKNRAEGMPYKTLELKANIQKPLDIRSGIITDKELNKLGLKILQDWDGVKRNKIPNNLQYFLVDSKEFVDAAKNKGFDAIHLREVGKTDETTYAVFNPNNLLIKKAFNPIKELTDIWNKANKK